MLHHHHDHDHDQCLLSSIGLTFQVARMVHDGSETTISQNIHFCASFHATTAALSMMTIAISLKRGEVVDLKEV